MEQKIVSPYENKPNRDALVQQREKYVTSAVEALFSNKDALAELGYRGRGTWHNYDDAVQWVYDELKNDHGIDESSSAKTTREFYAEYPKRLITDEMGKREKEFEAPIKAEDLRILERRYERGEIDKEYFEVEKKELEK